MFVILKTFLNFQLAFVRLQAFKIFRPPNHNYHQLIVHFAIPSGYFKLASSQASSSVQHPQRMRETPSLNIVSSNQLIVGCATFPENQTRLTMLLALITIEDFHAALVFVA